MLDKIEEQIYNYEGIDSVATKFEETPRCHDFQARIDKYYPLTKHYFFELNPSFVNQYPNIEMMCSYPVVMIRDGFYGLYYLFLRHFKIPPNIKTIFLIPKKFSFLIPENWKNNVLLYSFELDQKPREIRNQFIYGYASEDTFLKETPAEKAKKLIRKDIPLDLFSVYRYNFLNNDSKKNDQFMDFHKYVCKIYGSEFRLITDYQEKYFKHVDKHTLFKPIDEDHFVIYDDYMRHYLAAAGALSSTANPQRNEKTRYLSVNLSLYHKIIIEEPLDFSNILLKEFLDLGPNGNRLNIGSMDFYHKAFQAFNKILNNEEGKSSIKL